MFRLEQRAYDIGAQRFFQDPEDAQGTAREFYASSLKVLRLAVDADSSNSSAHYHLGLALARKSYKGWGEWDTTILRDAVGHLAQAEGRAIGRYAAIRVSIGRALAQERANLSALRQRH